MIETNVKYSAKTDTFVCQNCKSAMVWSSDKGEYLRCTGCNRIVVGKLVNIDAARKARINFLTAQMAKVFEADKKAARKHNEIRSWFIAGFGLVIISMVLHIGMTLPF